MTTKRIPLAVLGLAIASLFAFPIAPAGAAPEPKSECADHVDNDNDGLVDYAKHGGDPDCSSRRDATERFWCTDSEPDGQFDVAPTLPNAHVSCNLNTGEPFIAYCEPGYQDINGFLLDGCEYGPIFYTGPEVCDGIDNDVDGMVDDGIFFPDVPNGTLTCSQGGTLVIICDTTHVDANGDPNDGCEEAIPVTTAAVGRTLAGSV